MPMMAVTSNTNNTVNVSSPLGHDLPRDRPVTTRSAWRSESTTGVMLASFDVGKVGLQGIDRGRSGHAGTSTRADLPSSVAYTCDCA